MGLIRNTIIIIFSFILFLSLILMNIFLTLDLSSEYETIQLNHEKILNYQKIISPNETQTIEEIYYKNYSCSFLDCFSKEKNPLVFTSKIANDFWHNQFKFILMMSIILIISIFIFIKSKSSLFIISGICLTLSALPFIKTNWLNNILMKNNLGEFLLILFSKANTVSLIIFILGIIIFLIGIAFKLFNLGFKISFWITNLIEKYRQEKQNEKNKEELIKIQKEKHKEELQKNQNTVNKITKKENKQKDKKTNPHKKIRFKK